MRTISVLDTDYRMPRGRDRRQAPPAALAAPGRSRVVGAGARGTTRGRGPHRAQGRRAVAGPRLPRRSHAWPRRRVPARRRDRDAAAPPRRRRGDGDDDRAASRGRERHRCRRRLGPGPREAPAGAAHSPAWPGHGPGLGDLGDRVGAIAGRPRASRRDRPGDREPRAVAVPVRARGCGHQRTARRAVRRRGGRAALVPRGMGSRPRRLADVPRGSDPRRAPDARAVRTPRAPRRRPGILRTGAPRGPRSDVRGGRDRGGAPERSRRAAPGRRRARRVHGGWPESPRTRGGHPRLAPVAADRPRSAVRHRLAA